MACGPYLRRSPGSRRKRTIAKTSCARFTAFSGVGRSGKHKVPVGAFDRPQLGEELHGL